VLLFSLRPNVALVGMCGALVGLGLGLRNVGKGIVIGFAAVAVAACLTIVAGIGHRGLLAALGADLERVSSYRQALGAGAGSAINPDADISSPTAALAFLPTAASSFLLGPFPWQVKNVIQASGLLDAFALWILLPSLYRGIRTGIRDVGRRLWPLLGPALLLLIMLSLLISNYGTALRQRPQVMVFLVPIIAHGWVAGRRRRGRGALVTANESGGARPP
jgi:hypothetical protein